MFRTFRPYALPLLALIGCGSISDPTKNGEHTATVTGALTGTSVPANARVALVWRTGQNGGLAVGADVPVVNGKFSMTLTEPPDGFFFSTEGTAAVDETGGSAPPSTATADAPTSTPAPTPVPSGSRVIRPLDIVSGGIVTGDLTAAVGGFVVYEDTNGNGQLDIVAPASTTDTVIGGNKELLIADLRGGGALDYEKLRDKSGILPVQGLNLMWSEGRWLGLDLVELKINSSSGRLPSSVCFQYGTSLPLGESPDTSYPSPRTPPAVQCSADGRSYTYVYDNSCEPYVPPPPTLCNGGGDSISECASAASPTYTLKNGDPVPADWPCPVTPTPVPDAGIDVDGGSPDSGP